MAITADRIFQCPPLSVSPPAEHQPIRRCAPATDRMPSSSCPIASSGLHVLEKPPPAIVYLFLLFQGLSIQHKSVADAVAGIRLRIAVLTDRDIDTACLEFIARA